MQVLLSVLAKYWTADFLEACEGLRRQIGMPIASRLVTPSIT